MGRYLNQTESRSELQQRIAAELRAKAAAKAKTEGEVADLQTSVDGITDSQFIKGTKQTTTLAPVWGAIAVVTIVLVVVFIVITLNR